VESDIRDNPAMSRFEMPLGDGALAVAYHSPTADRRWTGRRCDSAFGHRYPMAIECMSKGNF
jgi:hypothetical protein